MLILHTYWLCYLLTCYATNLHTYHVYHMLIICNILITYFTYLKRHFATLSYVKSWLGKKLSFIILFASTTSFFKSTTCAHMSSTEVLLSRKRWDAPTLITSKKQTALKMLTTDICRIAMSQSLQKKSYHHGPHKKYPISEDRDHDRSPVAVLIKMPYFWGLRPWSQCSQKCPISVFLSLFRTATMIIVFMRTQPWSQSSLLGCFCLWCLIFESLLGLWSLS